MKKFLILTVLSSAVAFQASAAETAKTEAKAAPAPAAVEAPAAEAAKTEAKAAPAAKTEAKAVELKDGTKVQVEGDNVFVLDSKGERKPAPDGTHEAKDGTKLETKDGKIVIKK